MANKAPLTIWLVGTNDALRSALERSGSFNVRVFQEREIVPPQRYAAAPNLLILCREWGSQVEAFVRACGQVMVWLDLLFQTQHSAAAFRAFCQSRGMEGSTLELASPQLPWALSVLEAYRKDEASLLGSVPAFNGQSPVIYSSRLVRAYEIGARIDFLAQKSAGTPVLGWYTAISSLATLALDVVADLKTTAMPILPMYAGELVGDGTWAIAFQIPLPKGSVSRLPQVLNRLRFDENLRKTDYFGQVSRDCGALVVTVCDSTLELAVLFNPRTAPAASGAENLVFRRLAAVKEFMPQTCVYKPFPDRGPTLENIAAEMGTVNWVADSDSAVGAAAARSNKIFDRASSQLKKVQTVGSDESFVAFLKGMDGASGGAQSRFAKLIELVETSGTPAQGELIKDLIKRYITLVDEVRRKRAAA